MLGSGCLVSSNLVSYTGLSRTYCQPNGNTCIRKTYFLFYKSFISQRSFKTFEKISVIIQDYSVDFREEILE